MPGEAIEFSFQEETRLTNFIFVENARLALRMLRCQRNIKLSMSHMMPRSFAKIMDMSSVRITTTSKFHLFFCSVLSIHFVFFLWKLLHAR